ncbi:MAG: hypothetical protein MUF48_24075, partial [Pirellulaceae bacterium]|nr:hypothetical protein [Pirellulaceae bacterium]
MAGQVIYLDVDGARDVTYRGPVVVPHIDVPAFRASASMSGRDAELLAATVQRLEALFLDAGVQFTLTPPDTATAYSTIYVGGTGFGPATLCGDMLGLAEAVDVGNANRSDAAFVFADRIIAGASPTSLADVIAHEAGHLLGYEHSLTTYADTSRTGSDHTVSAAIENVGFSPVMHYFIARE